MQLQSKDFLMFCILDIVINVLHYRSSMFAEVLNDVVAEHKTHGTVSVPGITCTTSLLDSDESLNQCKQTTGFPTSTYLQFYILLKRTFLSTIRDQVRYV